MTSSGVETVRALGIEAVRNVVLDILLGKNLRSVTEGLTRRRIAALNLALVSLFLIGAEQIDQFVDELPSLAVEAYTNSVSNTPERLLAQWILGLTNKAHQNVLRSDISLLPEYRNVYVEACREMIEKHEREYGGLVGQLIRTRQDENRQTNIDWKFIAYLLNAVGAQTLSVRGSDKSTYGKLFERLVLGSLLSILDFTLIKTPNEATSLEKCYWLSSKKEDEREVDATLLLSPGRGIRFDIGFIGVGNTEITSDKTTRFREKDKYQNTEYYMGTVIIVDRLGKRSQVTRLAAQLNNAQVFQMSAS